MVVLNVHFFQSKEENLSFFLSSDANIYDAKWEEWASSLKIGVTASV